MIATNSGVLQVQPGSCKQALVAPLQTIAKNGYLYVYVSNESPQDVYFDDLTIKHYSGSLVQEQSYYPYGLQMQGLSDKALMKVASNYKYNAGSELEDEDGINYYNTPLRKYDQQIGRFTGIDMMAEQTGSLSPFQFGNNNPAMFNDPTGAFASFQDPNGDGVNTIAQQQNFFWGLTHQREIRGGYGMDDEGDVFTSILHQTFGGGGLLEIVSRLFDSEFGGNWHEGRYSSYENDSEGMFAASKYNMFFGIYGGGDGKYKTADAAAIGWALTYGESSIKSGEEYSSIIYESGGTFSFTPAIKWAPEAEYSSAVSSPGPSRIQGKFADLLEGVNQVGFLHSHGDFKMPTDEDFSSWSPGWKKDANFDIYGPNNGSGLARKFPNLIFYLFSPAGNLRKRDAENSWSNHNGLSYIIASGFYCDPAAREYLLKHPGAFYIGPPR